MTAVNCEAAPATIFPVMKSVNEKIIRRRMSKISMALRTKGIIARVLVEVASGTHGSKSM